MSRGRRKKLVSDPPPSALPAAPHDYYGTNLLSARAVALPRKDRPKLFIVADRCLGPSEFGTVDPVVLTAAVETLALLGMNCMQIDSFGTQQSQAQAVMASWGVTQFQYGIASPGSAFTWQAPSSDPNQVATWAAGVAATTTNLLKVPLDRVVLYHMHDEPSWYGPNMVNQMLSIPSAVTAFQTYLQAQGFAPTDFGQSEWVAVKPIQYSGAVDLPTRRLLFWTVRYLSVTYSDQQLANTLALRATINPTLLTTLNYNNGPRTYAPSPNQIIAASDQPATPDTSWAAPDWSDYGHKLNVGAHWTEDWFPNMFSEHWSRNADLIRSAAQLNGALFGGYVVGLALSQGTSFGGRYKALTLLGKGAKLLEWYTFGPSQQFPGNGWSSNPEAYGQIADANRLITRAEDLLYPGQPLARTIAVMLPHSSQVWDLHDDGPTTSDRPPHCVDELIGLHFALAQSQYLVDFVSEYDIPTRLANYDVLYVTGPNIAAATQSAIASWIAAGGVAWFGPGTGSADEYNTPTTTLDAVKGITTQTIARQWDQENFNAIIAPLQVLGTSVAGEVLCEVGTDTVHMQLERLTVTTATVLAQFSDDDSPAIVAQATGSGWAVACGTWLGGNYIAAPGQSGGILGPNWSARFRSMLTFPARVAQVARPVLCDVPLVEPARLDSMAGIAVTLLNWNTTPVESVTVTVLNCPTIVRAVLADAQMPVAFIQDGSTVTVTLPLENVDVLKLYV